MIFGVDERSRAVTGVEKPYEMKQELLDLLNNRKKVSFNVLQEKDIVIERLEDGPTIIKINIPEAPYSKKPIYLNENPRLSYERLGEGDMRLSDERYRELVVSSQNKTDGELLKGYDINDLNEEDLDIYRKALYEQDMNEKYLTIDKKEMLTEIGALRRDRQGDGQLCLTVGGLLFFGKSNAITDRFPGFQLDYFEKETSFTTDWIDRISTGDSLKAPSNIYGFYRAVIDKLKLTIKEEFILDEETKSRLPFRTDLLTSVREALVNALMHSYYGSDSPIKITAYTDYYEFINPGKMRITVEEFVHGGKSDIRNHTMSNIMRRIGLSEKAGSGGPRIFDIASKYKLMTPEVVRAERETVVRIWKVDLEKTFEQYPDNHQKILYYLIENGYIDKGTAKSVLLLDDYSFRKTIGDLLKDNVIQKVGQGRATQYLLKLDSAESAFSMKRMLRSVEDGMLQR